MTLYYADIWTWIPCANILFRKVSPFGLKKEKLTGWLVVNFHIDGNWCNYEVCCARDIVHLDIRICKLAFKKTLNVHLLRILPSASAAMIRRWWLQAAKKPQPSLRPPPTHLPLLGSIRGPCTEEYWWNFYIDGRETPTTDPRPTLAVAGGSRWLSQAGRWEWAPTHKKKASHPPTHPPTQTLKKLTRSWLSFPGCYCSCAYIKFEA